MSWIRDLALWVEHWAHTPYGPIALFAIAFAESSFFPIPPDVLLIALSLAVPEKAIFYAVICSIGSLLGGIFGYMIGKKGGRPILLKLFSVEKIETAAALYRKYDVWAVGIAGFHAHPVQIIYYFSGRLRSGFQTFSARLHDQPQRAFFPGGGVYRPFRPSYKTVS